jgi:quinone-modifying oxidoreductase, subunit QmoB
MTSGENTGTDKRPSLTALVVGNGLSGKLATKALISLGIDVTIAATDSPTSLFHCGQNESILTGLFDLTKGLSSVETVECTSLEILGHEPSGFLVRLGNENVGRYGCVVLATGASISRVSSKFPVGVKLLGETSFSGVGRRVCFLLDYENETDPAIAMNAYGLAIANRLSGGSSYIIFRNASVVHTNGEELYERAKRVGVEFFRYTLDRLPVISVRNASESEAESFSAVLIDAVETGEKVSIECDELLAGASIDASSLPGWASEILGSDRDSRGFLLSSSIHCHSGRSFRRGIFAVGEATGTSDLIRTVYQAYSVAVNARDWMLKASDRHVDQSLSVDQQCIRCLTCFRICPHGAIGLAAAEARSEIRPISYACEECGICVSECPRLALDLGNLPEATVGEFLRGASARKNQGPIVIYGCQRSVGRLASEIELPSETMMFVFPCTGRISEAILWATLASGARAVLVVGCHSGNCASENGNLWARTRVNSVSEQLAEAGLPDGIVRFETLAGNEPARFSKIIFNFMKELNALNVDGN